MLGRCLHPPPFVSPSVVRDIFLLCKFVGGDCTSAANLTTRARFSGIADCARAHSIEPFVHHANKLLMEIPRMASMVEINLWKRVARWHILRSLRTRSSTCIHRELMYILRGSWANNGGCLHPVSRRSEVGRGARSQIIGTIGRWYKSSTPFGSYA